MKKLIFALVALTFLAAECIKPVPTNEELLAQKKGWELYTATSYPAYTNNEGETSENLFVSYFYECDLDDILYFNENKSSILNFGKKDCEGQVGKDVSLGNWKFLSKDLLEFHLPYFFDTNDNFALLEGKVIILDANTFQVRIPVKFSDKKSPAMPNLIRNDRGMKNAKGDEPDFHFTLTYKVAK